MNFGGRWVVTVYVGGSLNLRGSQRKLTGSGFNVRYPAGIYLYEYIYKLEPVENLCGIVYHDWHTIQKQLPLVCGPESCIIIADVSVPVCGVTIFSVPVTPF